MCEAKPSPVNEISSNHFCGKPTFQPSGRCGVYINASLGQKATIDVKERTSDVRSFGARKEHHARSDFLGATISPERHGRNPGRSPIAVLGIHIRIYKTGLQSIYRDVACSQVSGGDTIEGTHGSFRCGIVGCAVEACTRSRSRTNGDDASMIGQNLRRSTNGCEHAVHINPVLAFDGGDVHIHTYCSHDKDGSVVDQNVELAKLFDHLSNQPFGFGSIPLVCANGKCTHTLCFNLLDDVSCLIGGRCVTNDYIRAFLRQRQCCSCSNTARTSRNKCNLTSKLLCHTSPSGSNRTTFPLGFHSPRVFLSRDPVAKVSWAVSQFGAFFLHGR